MFDERAKGGFYVQHNPRAAPLRANTLRWYSVARRRCLAGPLILPQAVLACRPVSPITCSVLAVETTKIAYNRSRYEMLKIGCSLIWLVNVLGVIRC
jgi:hypothetical protein